MKLFVCLQHDEGDGKKEEGKKKEDVKKAKEQGNSVNAGNDKKPSPHAEMKQHPGKQSSEGNAMKQNNPGQSKLHADQKRKKRSGVEQDNKVIHFCLSVL